MSKLRDAMRELFPATDPKDAAKGSSGETLATPPGPKERREGDYLPVIAIVAGLALVALAFLKPQAPPASPALRVWRNPQSEESSESDWPQEAPGY